MPSKHMLMSLIILFIYSGCGLVVPPLNPITSEDRVVKEAVDKKKQVVFNQPLVWYDSIKKNRGVLFPKGVYKIEAEDDEYYYFNAPEDLEYRIFDNGKTIDIRFMPGGLYLSKKAINMVPAGAYLSVSSSRKTLTWKLGGEFLRMEGYEWEKQY